MLTAPRMVRTERAVRPCLPMTLPTSWGATRSLRTVFSFRFTHQGPRNLADQFIHSHHLDWGHALASDRKHPKRSTLGDARIVAHTLVAVSIRMSRKRTLACIPWPQVPELRSGDRRLRHLGRILLHQFGDGGRQLRSHTAPVGDPL